MTQPWQRRVAIYRFGCIRKSFRAGLLQSPPRLSRSHVDPCRPDPHHALPLRPFGEARAAGSAAPPCPAQPHADPQLFAEGRSGQALRELAAGSARQLAGAAGVPRADARVAHRGRSGRRAVGDQPVRLFSRALRRDHSVPVRPGTERGAGAVPQDAADDAAVRALSGQGAARTTTQCGFSGGAEPDGPGRRQLPDPHGARRADARRNPHQWLGFLPRFGLAAGAIAAPSRAGRTLRLRLSDPAGARCQIAGWPIGHHGRLHRPARLVRGLPAWRRLDRSGPDLGPVCRRRSYSAGSYTRTRLGRTDQWWRRRERGRVRAHHADRTRMGSPARHQAIYRRAVAHDRDTRPSHRRRSGKARRAPDHGRRADLRGDGRSRWRRVEHRRARPDQAQAGRRAIPQAARQVRAAWHGAFRPGQVVSGRAVAALVAQLFLAPRRRAAVERSIAACRRAQARQGRYGSGRALSARCGQGAGRAARPCVPRLRGQLLLPVARTAAANQRRSARLQARRCTGAQASGQGVWARAE